MKVLCVVVVLCLVATFTSAKSLDEKVARMLMEDEDFKRGLFTPVCNAIERVINNYGGDAAQLGCGFVNIDFICDQVENAVGSYFGMSRATCIALLKNLIKNLQDQCYKYGTMNANIC